MTDTLRTGLFAGLVVALIVGTGVLDNWNLALIIVNYGLISAIMALGVNLQWGLAGLFNVGVMGFVALGGLAAVLISMPPVPEAWAAGGGQVLGALAIGAAVIAGLIAVYKRTAGRVRVIAMVVLGIVGFFLFRSVFDAGVQAIEAVNPASTGFLGGLNFGGDSGRDWPIMAVIAWPVGGMLAAGAAWIIGKTALGLRSDYLAIATLGIAEIIIAILKNENWMSRGVMNVIGLPRPVPYETDLQADPDFVATVTDLGLDPTLASTLWVKLLYSGLFAAFLIVLLILAQRALHSPWGRMMRAIRDNEVAARAMGKNVTARHLQVFIIGSAICGLAGAMMTTLDGQLTPAAYQPLRFTFLVWVMVIVGGSGNNFGSVLGGMLIWWLWVAVGEYGPDLMIWATAWMSDDSAFKANLVNSAPQMRFLVMGTVLLLILRFSPRGILPEK
ncbi:branched-chain amino acid ABC transporter permease [Loktanella sp. 3ANDIMAR09]|uniref:branched-chain amino acid ABC transporter permease n=1 Tax=Loktanella sp. 3ANDIMAR09 TaxID=1225657 RepID=UPI000B22A1DD|nr:branched-chain amino acid ABC transporter permease [Loktanella sp. 3ANDIMAR09]